MKIGFFTAGPIATSNELADIAVLESAGHQVCVRNVLAYTAGNYQLGADSFEDFDYVAVHAGTTYPGDYDDTNEFPVASLTAPPAAVAPLSTQKLISSGVEFLSPNAGGSYVNGFTPTIVAGAVTALAGS